jgi:opacity protein-like surface antigen
VGAAWGGGLSNQSFTVSSGGVTASATQGFSLGSGPSLAGQVGYDFGGPRVEGEFLWQNFNRPSTTVTVTGAAGGPVSASVGGSSVDTYALFLNGYYDFNTNSNLTPYVGAGIGVASLDASASSSGVITQSPGLNQSAFAYQAKVGVGYKVSKATTLYLQYRYVGTSSFNYGGARVNIGGSVVNIPSASGSLSNSSVELGVRLKL